jgi:hypothetical protein
MASTTTQHTDARQGIGNLASAHKQNVEGDAAMHRSVCYPCTQTTVSQQFTMIRSIKNANSSTLCAPH